VRSKLEVGVVMLVVLLLGGADFFAGTAWRAVTGMGAQSVLGIHHEWWLYHLSGIPLQYSSIVTALLWAPNQAIATFLVAALLGDGDGVGALWLALCSYCLLALWSPLGMIGLLPLALYTAFRIVRTGLRAGASWVALGVCAASSIGIALYLATDVPATGLAVAGLSQRLATAGDVLLFLLIELGPLVLLLRSRLLSDPIPRLCVTTLLVIPFLGGETPDFVMRASLGPLFVLAMIAARSVVESVHNRRGQQHAVVLALVLCTPTAISEVAFHLQAGSAIESAHPDDPARTSRWRAFAESPEVDLRQFLDACGWDYLPQYFSRRPSPILAATR
jgi:hypothetical protein